MAKLPIKNSLIVELHVPDFAPAKEFYSKLGFKVASEDVKGEYPGYLVMGREDPLGNTTINFYGDDERVYDQSYFKQFDRKTTRGYAVSLTIPVKDIHAFYLEVSRDLKENVAQKLTEKTDGKKAWYDFRMTDPYGFYIRFTELLDWGQ